MKHIVKHKAAWTLSQILSWVVPVLLSVVVWVLWLTDNFSMIGAVVCSVVLTAMGLFFLLTNTRLKNNSCLTAVLEGDPKYTINVSQHKPRPYWTGKLDVAKNNGSLVRVKSINFGETERVPYVIMSYNDSNNNSRALVIPFRILIQDEVRKYVAEGLQEAKNIRYRNDEEKERFAVLLAEGRDTQLQI